MRPSVGCDMILGRWDHMPAVGSLRAKNRAPHTLRKDVHACSWLNTANNTPPESNCNNNDRCVCVCFCQRSLAFEVGRASLTILAKKSSPVPGFQQNISETSEMCETILEVAAHG